MFAYRTTLIGPRVRRSGTRRSSLLGVDGVSGPIPGNADGRPFWTGPREVRLAGRFGVERAWRKRLDERLFVPGPVPEIPQPLDDDGRARISMRVSRDDRIRRDL